MSDGRTRRLVGASMVVDEDGQPFATMAEIAIGAAYSLLDIISDPSLLDKLLADDDLCARIFSAIEAVQSGVGLDERSH